MYLNNLEKYFNLVNNEIIDFNQTILSYDEFLNPMQFAIKHDFFLDDKQWQFLIENTNLNDVDMFNNSIFHLLLIFDKLKEFNKETVKFLVYNTNYKIKNHLGKNVLNLIFLFKDKYFLYLFDKELLLFIIKNSDLRDKIGLFENLSTEIVDKYYHFDIDYDIWDNIIYDIDILDKLISYYRFKNKFLINLKNNLISYRYKIFLEKNLESKLKNNLNNLNKI